MNKKTLQWIPLIPFDRVWNDEMLIEYFDLDKEDVEIIMNY
jgi:hypothetical protein